MTTLAALTKKRRNHVRSCQENKDNSHGLIAGLYSDRSHFIYELLQNADDAMASKVTFILSAGSLKFSHNGSKLFSVEDVESITTVGSSAKKDDVNKIGTFGAGFKSVFAVTKTPSIDSGDFHFRIVDYIVPEETDRRKLQSKETVIEIPFNRPDVSRKDACEQISESLKSLASECLLFLRHINEVQWYTESSNGRYWLKVNKKENTACLNTQVGDQQPVLKNYVLFKKHIAIDKAKLHISIAYRLDADSHQIIPVSDSKLFVFFPTKETPGFKFLVHAPYRTTPNRETIPLEDNDQNRAITDKLSMLIAESIQLIKDQRLLNVEFLSLLPIDSDNGHPLYRAAFGTVTESLKTNKLLPTSQKGKYATATNALLASPKRLATLLKPTDCSRLFEGRRKWLDSGITGDKTRMLRDYLMKKLEVPEIHVARFCQEINKSFMKNKTDKWVTDLYSFLTDYESSYGKTLRKKPIIRLENGSHVCPEDDNGVLQVYLPAKGKPRSQTVRGTIASNKQALDFLQSLGLKEQDDKVEIEKLIIQYRGDDPKIEKDKYIQDFGKVVEIWSGSGNEHKKQEIVELFRDVKFIGSVKPDRGFLLCNPEEEPVYRPTPELKMWFKGNREDAFYFLDDCMGNKHYESFLKTFDILTDPYTRGTEACEGYRNGPSYIYRHGLNGFNPEFTIDGLEFSLNKINIERSFYIFELALKHVNKLCGTVRESTRRYFDGLVFPKEQLSTAGKLLTEKYWLYDKEGILLKKPIKEVSIDDLHNDYKIEERDDYFIDKLIKVLGFKLDEIKQMEEKTGGKFIYGARRAAFEKWEAEQNSGNEQEQEDNWRPEIAVEDAPVNIHEINYQKSVQEDLSGQNARGNAENSGVDNAGREEEKRGDSNSNESHNEKNIGKWGEEYAKKYLDKKYKKDPSEKVIWLNENGNMGKGYDFVIKENDEDIAYYEVKSKTDETPELFQVTGMQWEWAKHLHDNKRGDMYRILLVSNATKPEAKIGEIKNPVALWKEGTLYADPVQIKL